MAKPFSYRGEPLKGSKPLLLCRSSFFKGLVLLDQILDFVNGLLKRKIKPNLEAFSCEGL